MQAEDLIAGASGIDRRNLLGYLAAAGLLAAGAVTFGAAPAHAAVTWFHPFAYRVGVFSGYGLRNGKMHYGADYSPAAGTPIYAVASGTVVAKTYTTGASAYGHALRIDHGVHDGSRWESLYAHMRSASPLAVNQQVTAGARVGDVGATGDVTGPHLHLEIRRDLSRIDPAPYVSSAPLAGSASPTPPPVPPAIQRKASLVFLAIRNNNVYLVVPQGDKNWAIVVGGQDPYQGFPQITFNWDTSWQVFKQSCANASSLAA